jgi:hypothetical protein
VGRRPRLRRRASCGALRRPPSRYASRASRVSCIQASYLEHPWCEGLRFEPARTGRTACRARPGRLITVRTERGGLSGLVDPRSELGFTRVAVAAVAGLGGGARGHAGRFIENTPVSARFGQMPRRRRPASTVPPAGAPQPVRCPAAAAPTAPSRPPFPLFPHTPVLNEKTTLSIEAM